MKIVVLSWLYGNPVPPAKYGGIERFCHTLCLELDRQGHEVILIAPEGSSIPGIQIWRTSDFGEARHIINKIERPDVVHDNSCWSGDSPVRAGLSVPFISTTHVNHAIGWSKNVVYLSHSQRDGHAEQLGRSLNNSPVIRVPTNPTLKPKGLPKQDYLLYLGMVTEHKGVLEAAYLARELNTKLVVAGPAWGEYADKIQAVGSAEFVGEVGDPYRSQLLEQARAVMCLHNNHGGWREPGCGVVQEAGAFDTPVAALPNGCLPEIVINQENGWIAEDWPSVVELMQASTPSDPGRLARTEWSAEFIVKQYVELYARVILGHTWE